MRFDAQVIIAAPPAHAWEIYTDVERWPEWTASMRTVELLDGALRLGARVRIDQPRLPTVTWTVSELTPGRSWTWVASSAGARTAAGHVVAARPDGSTRVEQSITQTGPVGVLFGMLFARLTKRYLAMEGEGLRARCESA